MDSVITSVKMIANNNNNTCSNSSSSSSSPEPEEVVGVGGGVRENLAEIDKAAAKVLQGYDWSIVSNTKK